MKPTTPAALAALATGDIRNFMVAATPGGIERQEAEGQKEFVAAVSMLPRECPRADLEKLGFVFGEMADDLFINVTFPEGWTKRATDHSMWSELLDPKGRKRASIFYKAAFYDRRASMHGLNRRYTVTHEYKREGGPERYYVQDWDETVLFFAGEAVHTDRAEVKGLEDACIQWLDENKPNYKDELAYWD